ncbi:Holliday junction branch migration protein RuvA [Bacillus horti]|uniref:Holliday junction branch migration complex subunit RuvA n=1 Tax=Caldalkalibacillus horti TaxID=77523 RepID=A0ABT9VTP6_9BACI|nr:Holliday junction branch migration protein RuvA [Bacillus horti]MDQ0164254.1 Holliday junction DNA helicase RuvA [Bacillus horti]
MIDYIKGTLTHIDIQYVVLESCGVGYQILCGNPFYWQEQAGREVQIFTFQYVREDTNVLYGFSTREERGLFLKLLNVSGIGPKGALSILASGQPGQVIVAIQTEDAVYLSKFPGIGKKTAQRIILDLKDKLETEASHFGFSGLEHIQEASASLPKALNQGGQLTKALQEALEALMALGYSEKEVKQISTSLKQEAGDQVWSTDQFLKRGLQLLMK